MSQTTKTSLATMGAMVVLFIACVLTSSAAAVFSLVIGAVGYLFWAVTFSALNKKARSANMFPELSAAQTHRRNRRNHAFGVACGFAASVVLVCAVHVLADPRIAGFSGGLFALSLHVMIPKRECATPGMRQPG